MITADIVALGLIALFAIIGLVFGFGNGLKFITSGIFGFIISIAVCYFISGFVLNIDAVGGLIETINQALVGQNVEILNFLVEIGVATWAIYVVMFIAVQIVRIILVNILKGIFEINNGFIRFINKLLGVVLYLAILAILALIVFQIIAWVGGTTETEFRALLDGSLLKLDYIFDNNLINFFN